ncbi:MAG: ABC transporter permease [Pontiellaceae bacterium]|nr:ABC transporter permease [Pontiellaceae bacterium]
MIRLLWSSLRFYWKVHLGVLSASALAAAVLTGSLLVGDSMDGTLQRTALQRLGTIHYAMQLPHRFVSESLVRRMEPDAAGLLQLRGMAMTEDQQLNQVQVIGCDASFWRFSGIPFELATGEVALSRRLADALLVQAGDEISLRMDKPGLLPMDAPLARQEDRAVRGRYTVKRIVGDDELGRFGLSVSQVPPYNAFVNLHALQERVDQPGRINTIVTGEQDPSIPFSRSWTPEDFGLHFVRHDSIVQLESDGIYLDAETARAAHSVSGAVGTLTYLVNALSCGDLSTPYSFVVASGDQGLGEQEMLINRWLADRIHAGEGDAVRMRYYELLPNGTFEERERNFTVRGILEMESLDQERELAPPFPGLTDVDRCADWDIGMPMEEAALEDADNEAYWEAFRQMPKAVISLAAGQSMWANRFGALTTVRWTTNENVETAFREAYQPERSGFRFMPVRQQALESVAKAMDFGRLFVGMSFFLIVSALLLTAMVFVFGVQERSAEMGVLMAAGWSRGRIRRLHLLEGGWVALLGSMLGGCLGIGYTRLLIFGLTHAWGGAVAHAGIQYFASPTTLVTGMVVSFCCALSAMALAAWRQMRHSARDLLQADFSDEIHPQSVSLTHGTGRRVGVISVILAALSLGLVAYSLVVQGRNLSMLFFGAGGLLLVAGVMACSIPLQRMGLDSDRWSLKELSRRNAGRRRSRSLAVIALMASGCFLVFAVSSMQENVTAHADQPDSGTGGFPWFGRSSLPIREGLDGVGLRVHDGDDASCLNLSRARVPTLLGIDPVFMSGRRAFLKDDDVWQLLEISLPDGMIPGLVGDTDTAMWGLEVVTGTDHGDVLDYEDEFGNPIKIKLVGALPMRLSLFQGTVLISEKHFVECYPGESGNRMFLLDQKPDLSTFERQGLDVVRSIDRLRDFYSVESTYLAMFLVLGAMGLVVGSLGMGVVVLRNVQERRAEIALLQAVGYRTGEVRRLLFMEHVFLLGSGLGIGLIAAFVAMIPALFITRTDVSVAGMGWLLLLVLVCSITCMAVAVRLALHRDALCTLRNE